MKLQTVFSFKFLAKFCKRRGRVFRVLPPTKPEESFADGACGRRPRQNGGLHLKQQRLHASDHYALSSYILAFCFDGGFGRRTSPRPFSRVGLHGRGAGVASRIDFEQDTDQLRRRPTIRILTAGAARSAWRDRRLEGGGTFGRLREHERSASVGQRTRAQAAA